MNGMSWRWAMMVGLGVASVACTITTTDSDGGGSAGSSGSAGSADTGGSAGAAGTAGDDGGDSGAAGADDTDAGDGSDAAPGVCTAPTGNSACETCGFASCETEYCACLTDADCADTVKTLDYFGCLDFAASGTGDVADCDMDVIMNTATDEGQNLANDLGECLHGNGTPPGCVLECGS